MFTITLIYLLACAGWMVLGSATALRSMDLDTRLSSEVSELWGGPLVQLAPEVDRLDEHGSQIVVPEATDLKVHIDEDARRKGLIWYPAYSVGFQGTWTITNHSDSDATFRFRFVFPDAKATYDQFDFAIDGQPVVRTIDTTAGMVEELPIPAGGSRSIGVAYETRGLETWRYRPGHYSGRVRNLTCTVSTDFRDYDYTAGALPADSDDETDEGMALTWDTRDLITQREIGLIVPERLNPGPVTSRITFFAPVCLGFFFLLLAAITIVCRIPIHPMHYLFVAGGFFAFHLLLAYLVDHLTMAVSFGIAAAVSCALNTLYLRTALGGRFPVSASLGGQGFFLVLFSYSFFFTGFTGLTVALGSVATLAVLMAVTAKTDWHQVFKPTPKLKKLTVEGEALS
jgi:hypothetical protein